MTVLCSCHTALGSVCGVVLTETKQVAECYIESYCSCQDIRILISTYIPVSGKIELHWTKKTKKVLKHKKFFYNIAKLKIQIKEKKEEITSKYSKEE